MIKKILSALGMGERSSDQPRRTKPSGEPGPLPIEQRRSVRRRVAAAAATSRAIQIRPYRDETCNFIYNLLFCDDLTLFHGSDQAPWMTTLLAGNPDELRALADDAAAESRVRALAFNRLRGMGEPVPARLLLGTILEVPVNDGLDTLAAFEDGDVRYINHTEKFDVFTGRVHTVEAHVDRLMAASRVVVDQIGPWTEARLPPPPADEIRITFLVSDGLYFGQGPYQVLASDQFGGPVIAAGLLLLQAIVDLRQTTSNE